MEQWKMINTNISRRQQFFMLIITLNYHCTRLFIVRWKIVIHTNLIDRTRRYCSMTCTIGHFNWQKKMHIVVPLTAIKADGKTWLEFKGVHTQLETQTPKIVCIEFPEVKMVLFLEKWFYACVWTTCQGMGELRPRNRNFDCGSVTHGKTGFYLVTVGKKFGWTPDLAWVCVTTGDCLIVVK